MIAGLEQVTPHMSVRQNIAFPLRKQKLARSQKDDRVREVAQLLAIEKLLDRKPRELSGGQRRRVAMGRAIRCERSSPRCTAGLALRPSTSHTTRRRR